MTDNSFRTNENKERGVGLHVSHSPEWETEPGHVRPQTFMFSATNAGNRRTGAVILTKSETIALRDWLSEHLK
jgi:hypothetical protein